MPIIQIIINLYKKKITFKPIVWTRNLKILNFKPIIILGFIVFFSILFFTISNLIGKKNVENKINLSEVTQTSEFFNLTNYFISRINSPYVEVNYVIKNNDTILQANN